MKNLKQSLLFLFLSIISLTALAFPTESRVPGGLAIIELDKNQANQAFTFNKKPVLRTQHEGRHLAIVGLPLNLKPGEYFISARNKKTNTLVKKFFHVKDKKYTTQHIKIKDKRKVNPYQKDMSRISAESKRKKKAARDWNNESPDLDFLLPVKGINTGSYGKRRYFNGQARRPHSGMDIATDKGKPIASPAAGTVIESGDFFFSGNIVYIQHGQGLITLFAHLDRIDVKVGDKIEKGQIIGTVGATGRVTGPHLHWSVGLNGSWIDPALFIPQQGS